MGKMPGPIGPIRLIFMLLGNVLKWVIEIELIAFALFGLYCLFH